MTELTKFVAFPAVRDVPETIRLLGPAATYAWDEFFSGSIRNIHTRTAYLRAVKRFLAWLEPTGLELPQVTPGMVGTYLDSLTLSLPSKKLELAGLRAFFDTLTLRHVIVINPALSVRTERYSVTEGLTPEISSAQAGTLLRSIDTNRLIGLRDRAVIGCLLFTAARAGAVAKLTRGSFQLDGTHYRLRFQEKRGKSRDIPVRHDLEGYLLEYMETAGMTAVPANTPLFRTGCGKLDKLSARGMSGIDICRMVKRRLGAANMPTHLSPHSFRVSVATDLLRQGVPLEDVQSLLGHSDPRTTRLYDRRQKLVTRNVVERISI